MNRFDLTRMAYRHGAVALKDHRERLDQELLDEERPDGTPLNAEERKMLEEELSKLQKYLEDVADPPGPEAFDHLPAGYPSPVTASPGSPQWVADAVAMEAWRAREARGPDLAGSPDTGYCAPAIGVHVEPHRGCVMR